MQILNNLVLIIRPVATLLETHVLNPIYRSNLIIPDKQLLSGKLPSLQIIHATHAKNREEGKYTAGNVSKNPAAGDTKVPTSKTA